MRKVLFIILLFVGFLLPNVCLGQGKLKLDRGQVAKPISTTPPPPPHITSGDNSGKAKQGTSIGNKGKAISNSTLGNSKKAKQVSSRGKGIKQVEAFSITPTSVNCSSDGGVYNFEVKGSVNWHISEDTYSWGHVTKSGNSVKLIIDKNTETNARSDNFKISNGKKELSVSIKQAAADVYIFSNINSLSFGEQSTTQIIPISSNGAWSIMDFPSSWASVKKYPDRVEVTTETNNSFSDRQTYITVAAGSKTKRIDIRQAGSEPKLSVSSNNIEISADGESRTVYVNSDLPWKITVQPLSWINIQTSGNTIAIRVNRYNGTAERKDYFEISDGKNKQRIYVSQNSSNRIYSRYSELNSKPKYRESKVRTYLGGKFQYGTFMGVGGTLGMYIYGVNLEGHYLTSIQQPKQIYWNSNTYITNEQTVYQYKPTQYGGKLGYAIRLGKNFRLVPQAGVNVVSVKGTKMYGWGQDTNAMDGYSVAAVGGLKFDIRFAKWVGISLTPEYSFPVQQSTVFKVLSENTNEIKKYAEGFNGCATLFFEF